MFSRIPKKYLFLKIIYKKHIIYYVKNQKKSLDDYNGDISRNKLWGHPKNTFLVMHTVEAVFAGIEHFFC